MKKGVVRATVLGGLVVFLWNMFSWMALPWHEATVMRFKDQRAVIETIMTNAPADGVYMVPSMDNGCCGENGPEISIVAAVRTMGGKTMFPAQIIIGIATQLVAAGFVVWMVSKLKGGSFGSRVFFVTCVGFFAGLVTLIPSWNWMGYSLGYVLVGMMDLIIGWSLGGLAIVKFLKEKK